MSTAARIAAATALAALVGIAVGRPALLGRPTASPGAQAQGPTAAHGSAPALKGAADRRAGELDVEPIWGRVVDASGPVQGARVRWQGAPTFVLSDARGRFDLPPADAGHSVVTAARPGYYIGSAEYAGAPLEICLERPVEPDTPDYAWVDPVPDAKSAQNCGNCHGAIFDQWQASGHAAGLANRHFLNLYDGSDWHRRPGRGWSLLEEHPAGAGVCASCHAPAADLDDPQSDDIRGTIGVAAGGVQCDFCHKVVDVAVDRLGWQHGRFAMTLLRPATSRQVFFGPLDDSTRGDRAPRGDSAARSDSGTRGDSATRGDNAYLPLESESRFCAACHEGIVFGVPVYTTYSEWLASPARAQGKQCQTCHMAPDGELHNIAPGAGGIERMPETLASHDLLPGGKAAMLRKALHLDAEILPEDPVGGRELIVTLCAEGVGHQLPTGFIDRHLVLSVAARDARGAAVELLAGPRLGPTVGEPLAGQPGVLLARLLTGPEQESPAPFWRAGVTIADTRLVPGEPAVSRYGMPAAAARVDVRLEYRRFWRQVARDKDWPNDDIVVIERSYPVAAAARGAD